MRINILSRVQKNFYLKSAVSNFDSPCCVTIFTYYFNLRKCLVFQFLKLQVLERKDIDNVESIYKIFRKTAESTTDLTKRFAPFFTKSGKEVNLSNAIAIVNE